MPSKIGDGRLLLDAYRTWGEDCVDHLLGDFAFAIWDERRHQLFLARDHFGAKPLTYHSSDDLFAFASDSRSVVGLEDVPKTVNRDRVFDFLVGETEWFDTTSTFFDQVSRLPPAHTLTVRATDRRLRRYWHLPEPETLDSDRDAEYEEATREVLDQAVACRLRGCADVGVMLSGGIDSASIAATALGHGPVFTLLRRLGDDEIDRDGAHPGDDAALADHTHVSWRGRPSRRVRRLRRGSPRRESLFTNGAMPPTRLLVGRCRRPPIRAHRRVGRRGGRNLTAACDASFLADHQHARGSSGLAASNGNLRTQQGRIGLARSALSSVAQHSATGTSERRLARRRPAVGDWKQRAHRRRLHLRLDPRRNRASRPTPGHNAVDSPAGTTALARFVTACSTRLRRGRSRALRPISGSLLGRVPEPVHGPTCRRVLPDALPAQQLVSGGWTKSVLRRSMVGACFQPRWSGVATSNTSVGRSRWSGPTSPQQDPRDPHRPSAHDSLTSSTCLNVVEDPTVSDRSERYQIELHACLPGSEARRSAGPSPTDEPSPASLSRRFDRRSRCKMNNRESNEKRVRQTVATATRRCRADSPPAAQKVA